MFGKGGQSEVEWLRARVEFLENQLTMIADQAAIARLSPRPESKPSNGKTRTPWRFSEDRPTVTPSQAAVAGHETAVKTEQAFSDPRQP